MDFFAIVGASKVYRIDTNSQVQGALEAAFLSQADCLLSDDLAVVPFTGGSFSPDETEVLEIELFDLPSYIFDAIQNAVGCETLAANGDEISNVSCVFGYDSSADILVFQVLPKQQRILPEKLAIFLSNGTFTRLESPGLVFSSACHAAYKNGSLRFRSMWWIKQIFDISGFYRAATEQDVDNFAAHPRLIVDDVELLRSRAGQWARKRIAFILDSGILDNFPPDSLAADAEKFGVPLLVEADENDPTIRRLKIPLEGALLRSVLKFLEEEYYEGPITGQKYETNSKRPKGL